MKNKPLVSIVLVTWNGETLLQKHLNSVLSMDYPNKEVIIVDNGSHDNSVEYLKQHHPAIKVIALPENLGTAEGSNVALPHCSGKYVFWISNDMEFESDLLTLLIDEIESDETVGVCTVKMRRLIDGKKTDIIDSVGASVDLLGFPSAVGIEQEDRGQHDQVREVFFSFGGALLIRKELTDSGIVYDPDFLTLTDDIDLCWRVRLRGYKVKVVPQAILYHRVSATLSKSHNRAEKRFISERNTMRTLLKNYSFLSLLFLFPLYLALLIGESLFFLAIGKIRMATSNLRAVLWNAKRIGGTLRLRHETQRSRRVSDFEIFKHMDYKSEKIRLFVDFLSNRTAPRWKNYF